MVPQPGIKLKNVQCSYPLVTFLLNLQPLVTASVPWPLALSGGHLFCVVTNSTYGQSMHDSCEDSSNDVDNRSAGASNCPSHHATVNVGEQEGRLGYAGQRSWRFQGLS